MRFLSLAAILAATIAMPVQAAPDPAGDARAEGRARMERIDVAQRGDGGNRGWRGGEGRQRQAQAPAQAPQAQSQAQPQGNWGGRGRGWNRGQAAPAQAVPQQRGDGSEGRRPRWEGGGARVAPQASVPQAAPVQRGADQGGYDRRRGDSDGNWQRRRAEGSSNGQWQGRRNDGNPQGNWQGRRSDGGVSGGAVTGQSRRNDGNRNWEGRRDDDRRASGQNNGNRNWSYRNRDGRNDGWRDGRRDDNRRYDRSRNDRYEHSDRGRHDWNRGWRDDRRYDWRGYRNQYRSYYRQPRYYNPYGYSYGYRRFGIGIYLDSLFYSNSYWINDPYQYRLPPAYGSYRWVRYYDDALLVDVYSGYVVDVIHDFFW